MGIEKFLPVIFFFIRYGAIFGLIVTTTLLINLNFVGFRGVFKEKTKTYYWLFSVIVIIPLLVFLYTFSLFFEPSKLNPKGDPILNAKILIRKTFSTHSTNNN